MIGRFVLVLTVVVMLVSLVTAIGLRPPVSAQDLLPTPEGRLGGREPLPTAEGLPAGPRAENTPAPSGHPLIGVWLFTFGEPDRAPAQALFGDEGIVTLIDDAGNRGAGVWAPNGPQSGVVAVAARKADASGRSAQITMLQGQIDVQTTGDATTLVYTYTVAPVDGSGATAETTGPFTAIGQPVDDQLVVPAPE